MVLQTFADLGSQHGYAIGARVEQVSSGTLSLNMGASFPGPRARFPRPGAARSADQSHRGAAQRIAQRVRAS